MFSLDAGAQGPGGIVSLGAICNLVKGETPTMKSVPGNYPLVVTGAAPRSSNEFQFDCEAVCIPLVSSTGHGHAAIHRIHFQSGKFALANIMVALVPKHGVPLNAKFLHLFLSAHKDELLVPLMAGTSNVSLRVPDLAEVPVWLPPLETQERIASGVEQAFAKLETAKGLVVEIHSDFDRLLLASARQLGLFFAPRHSLHEVAPLNRRIVDVLPEQKYDEIACRSFGKGVFEKPSFLGSELSWQRPNVVRAGDVLLSNIKAWEGAIAVVSSQHNGKVVSHRYLTLSCLCAKILPEVLCYYLLSPEGLEQIGAASPGTADRNRTLNVKKLHQISIPILPMDDQLRLKRVLKAKEEFLALNTLEIDAESLRRSILSKAFRGEL